MYFSFRFGIDFKKNQQNSSKRVGEPGGTPGPVEMEDSGPKMSHSFVVRSVQDDTYSAVWTRSPSWSSHALRSVLNPAIHGLGEVEVI